MVSKYADTVDYQETMDGLKKLWSWLHAMPDCERLADIVFDACVLLKKEGEIN